MEDVLKYLRDKYPDAKVTDCLWEVGLDRECVKVTWEIGPGQTYYTDKGQKFYIPYRRHEKMHVDTVRLEMRKLEEERKLSSLKYLLKMTILCIRKKIKDKFTALSYSGNMPASGAGHVGSNPAGAANKKLDEQNNKRKQG